MLRRLLDIRFSAWIAVLTGCCFLGAQLVSTKAWAAQQPVLAVKSTPVEGISSIAHAKFYQRLASLLTESGRFSKVLGDSELTGVDLSGEGDKVDKAKQAVAVFEQMVGMAKASYDELKMEQAIAQYEKALETLGSSFAYLEDNSQFAEACLTLAMAYRVNKQDDRAAGMIESLAVIAPDLEPDASAFPPKFISYFKDVRDRRLAKGRGKIKILSTQVGVRVFLDGKFRGEIPTPGPLLLEDIPVGDHFLYAGSPIHRGQFTRIPVEKDVREVRIELPSADLGIHFVPVKNLEAMDKERLDTLHKFADHPKVQCDIALLSSLVKDRNGKHLFRAQLFDARIDLVTPTLKVDFGYALDRTGHPNPP